MEKTCLKLIYTMALFIVAIDFLCFKVAAIPGACSTDDDCAYLKIYHCNPFCDWGEVCDCVPYKTYDHGTTNTNLDPNLSPV
ncbi:hypothetical protein RND71_007714 [Anisodus tanguticus]|uniref:Uncharacterized protein n=1 Tax=Anisodus tanguticus TaxID=243964 RepID=A0AAE1SLV6_9SOLA|nr:hypothetical protein RND71_007714 [Anisodus tanguticus]